MPISVSNQAYVFLWAVIGGMLIGFIYDAFRIKRKAIRTNSIITHFEDLIFWVVVALVMFAIVYYSNEGEIRGYNFIGTLIGVVLYALLLSKIIVKSSMFIIGLIYKILNIIWKVVTYPFKLAYRIMSIPGRFFSRSFSRAYKSARRVGRSKLSRAKTWGRIFNNMRKKI